MKKFVFLFLIIVSISVTQKNNQYQIKDQCFICHQELGGAADLFKKDIHFQNNISCSDCHGGDNSTDDMEKGMNKNAGYIGIPKGDEISKRCGRCHSNISVMKKFNSNLSTNQEELLQQSVHGKLSINGKEKIVQCTTCHNAHGIVSVKNPSSPVYPLNVPGTCSKCHSKAEYIRLYNPSLPVDQLNKYRSSIHGIRNNKGDSKTAECASCHGSHNIRSSKDAKSSVYILNLPQTCSNCHSNKDYMKQYKIPTDQFEKFARSIHGKALLEKHDLGAPACNSCHGNHSATPPGVESISKVCGTCHTINADLFSSSPHKAAFDKENLPECETCHGNHEIITAANKLLGVSEDAICSKCHKENETSKGYKVSLIMKKLIDSLDLAETKSKELIQEAEQKGMEISESKFKLRDAHQAKLEARTMVHSFDEEKFKSVVVGKGLSVTSIIIQDAQKSINDFYFRRYGLGISVLIISFLAGILYLYIRKIEKKE